MSREEILAKIKDLGITIEENKIENFRQLFEDRDVLKSALINDWTLYRYVPEELQNNNEIISLTTQGMPESLFYDENYASTFEGIYDESEEAMDPRKDSSRKITSRKKRKTDDQGGNASGPSNDSNENDYGRNSGVDGNNGSENGNTDGDNDENIEQEIEEFRSHYDELIKKMNNLLASLVLGTGLESLDFKDAIVDIRKELEKLDREANELINDIDEFRKNALVENPSMTVPEINAAMKNIKERLLELKKFQIKKYNSRVNEINNTIDELSSLTDVPQNIVDMIGDLKKLDLCNDVSDYRDFSYLGNINYDDLLDRYNRINTIEEGLGRGRRTDTINFGLDSDIHHIKQEIERANYYIILNNAPNSLDNIINDISISILNFKTKLYRYKEQLSLDDYNFYLNIINDDEARLIKINDNLSNNRNDNINDSLYQEFLTRLNNLSRYVNSLEILVEALKGNVYENTIDVFKSKLNGAARSLSQIRAEIEQAKNEGKLDNVQYSNLNAKMIEIGKVINRSSDKLLDPEMVMGGDTFTLINGNIDRLKKEIEKLENRINTLEQPIKDRKVRKDIDKIIANLEREIKVIRSILKKHKDEDEEKYQASVERLDKLEDRLSKISKNYRSKCPLRVKSVKSAKAFYKKHKKPILIALGIAALAVELTVGPVIIPAIMQGNLMIMNKLPFTRPLFKSLNKVLAGCIGASEVTFKGAKVWKIATGAIINPTCASVSLLKGVALASGTSTLVPLVAGAVAGIKALNEKMKKSKLKEKIINTLNNVKLNYDNLDKLYSEYKKFNGTVEEFAEFYGLDQQFVEMLNKLDNERSNGERQPKETNDSGRSR